MSRRHREPMRVLIGEITGGRYAPGDLLPRETDLADAFGVSRGVARECLRGLEERGLIAVRHGHGAIVAADDSWDVFDPDVLAALLAGDQVVEVLSEYLHCRRVLEVEAAGLAAELASDDAVGVLREAFARMCETAERARITPAAERFYHEADIEFHRTVVRMTGNRALGRMTEPIHRALTTTFATLAQPQARFERGLPEHERVLDTIADRDVEGARAAMMEHLLTVEKHLHDSAADLPRGAFRTALV